MRVLVLGGTAWLGGRAAAAALAAGHRVTCLARGSAPVPDGAVLVRADRDEPGAYDAVTGERWDLVLDVSRQPGQVRRAVEALEPVASHLVFVSSGNAYSDQSTPGQDESAPLPPALESDVMESMETYGRAKVACEQHVLRVFGPERSLIARVGLIGGPGDTFDRTGYWPLRFRSPAARDGRVLVPDAPDLPTQVLDVRDLADWLIRAGTAGVAGTVNAGGDTIPLGSHLEVARGVAGHTGRLVPADLDWLLEHGVEPWAGERSLPLWLPAGWTGLNARDSSRARQAGLVCRPLGDTLADTLAWELGRDRSVPRRAGLPDDVERELLAALAAAS